MRVHAVGSGHQPYATRVRGTQPLVPPAQIAVARLDGQSITDGQQRAAHVARGAVDPATVSCTGGCGIPPAGGRRSCSRASRSTHSHARPAVAPCGSSRSLPKRGDRPDPRTSPDPRRSPGTRRAAESPLDAGPHERGRVTSASEMPGGTAGLSVGESNLMTIYLATGRYVMLCLIEDPVTRHHHPALGTVRESVVRAPPQGAPPTKRLQVIGRRYPLPQFSQRQLVVIADGASALADPSTTPARGADPGGWYALHVHSSDRSIDGRSPIPHRGARYGFGRRSSATATDGCDAKSDQGTLRALVLDAEIRTLQGGAGWI